MDRKYACPCCGYLTLNDPPPGSFDICPVCFWEDDNVQYHNPKYVGGANGVSLEMARLNYKQFGAMDRKSMKYVRKPLAQEIQ